MPPEPTMRRATTIKPSNIPVVILAGGRGTRLRPLTFAVPKPLLWAGREPILGVTLRRLRQQGFQKVFLALGYHAELIRAYLAQHDRWGLDIETTQERAPLGTAGPLGAVVDGFALSGPILVMNGDLLTSARYDRLVQHHIRLRGDITVALLNYLYRLPLGEVQSRKGRILGIREKPVLSFDVSAGMYVVNAELTRLIPRGRAYDMPELIREAIRRRRRVLGYSLRDRWLAVEQVEDLELAARFERGVRT
jgi:NDP-sugar pyrophosphorylase family protein